jgi:hypothetical protein
VQVAGARPARTQGGVATPARPGATRGAS